MTRQYVADIKDRDPVKGVFLVKEKIMAMAKNGKPYMNLRFMDKSGEVDAKLWDNTDVLDKLFDKNDFVRVRGKASVYMNKMQVVVAEISRVPDEEVNLADFLPESPRSIGEMRQELRDVVGALDNSHLKGLMEAFLADEPLMDQYCKAPAAKGMHHVYLGGLLEHSLALVRLIRAIVPLYEGINEDLLVVGALLHDVGKIQEMSYERAFDYTDAGKLLGHITIGVELVEDKIRQVDGFPRELSLLLKHMLLSHHGQYEFGSPKRPKTVEATILNYLDDMDSKINGIRTHIAKETASSSRWTAHHRLYDRYFFKVNGLDGEEEPVCAREEGCQVVPLEELPPPAVQRPVPRREKQVFSNQPLRKLENLNLFGNGSNEE
ncbi:3'-5' exoribonuclease YhaM family protein [Pelobacter propionicus]|uniref:Metal dependent phosphohydrolase n=1 Tax=Pelobacter propionicus (strain DSM 2379 / NBRC 103807 / OttBd1) TaxID=338966 RepID=A1AL53_PELPD|nr:HD domain-containing protein [Pelobacter propionicus]ABK98073.1 metal dependent phosphohydrolase [Pelobacter propionicus DSM 2379]